VVVANHGRSRAKSRRPRAQRGGVVLTLDVARAGRLDSPSCENAPAGSPFCRHPPLASCRTGMSCWASGVRRNHHFAAGQLVEQRWRMTGAAVTTTQSNGARPRVATIRIRVCHSRDARRQAQLACLKVSR
jgi:hypothetical protein